MVRVRNAHHGVWLTVAALVLLAAGPAQALQADLKANRTSGVAPLSVFFDARGTSHPNGSINEFHDLNYDFDFGDPGSGHWGENSGNAFLARQSKNEYHGGPMAGHVYEKPGTYTAKVRVRDGQGGSSTAQVTIRVQDPDQVFSGSNTICYSNSGNFSGCPSGAQRKTTSSFSQVLGDARPGRRLLLRRGDSFSGRGSTSNSGPGLIAAFGSGPKPRITNGGQSEDVLSLGSDWRIVDLDSRTPSSGEARHFACAWTDVRAFILLLRVEAHGGDRAFGCVDGGGRRNEDIAVVDSVLQDQKNTAHLPYTMFHVGSARNMFMGNTIGGSGGHGPRFPWANQLIFTFNYFNKAPKKANFRLHGKDEDPTRWVIFGYNAYGQNAGGTTNISNVSSSFRSPIYDVIFEGNFIPHGQRDPNFGVDRASIRNNIMRVSNGSIPMLRIWVRGYKGGAQFDVDNIWVYNNTLVWTDQGTATMVRLFEQDGGVFNGDAHFRENLVYAPGRKVEAFPTGSRFQADGNLIVTNSSQNPFVSGVPGSSVDDYQVRSSIVAGATDDWFEGLEGSGTPGDDEPEQLAAPFLY